MDSKTPGGDTAAKTLNSERIALNVLALCFVLALLGRGLSDSFTVFLKPISENFGSSRASDAKSSDDGVSEVTNIQYNGNAAAPSSARIASIRRP